MLHGDPRGLLSKVHQGGVGSREIWGPCQPRIFSPRLDALPSQGAVLV
jgi:hypothetical protein